MIGWYLLWGIHDKIILNEKNKKIIVKKTGVGNTIFNLAHNQPGTYGIICIFFAIFAGIIVCTSIIMYMIYSYKKTNPILDLFS